MIRRMAMLSLLVLPLVLCAEDPPAQKPEKTASDPPKNGEKKEAELAWFSTLSEGLAEAQRRQAPVLVKAGADWCKFCREFDREIRKDEVQKELRRWVLVAIDVDRSPKDAERVAADSLPSLRILSPAGKIVASDEGARDADEFVEWLTEHHDTAAPELPPELTEEGEPAPAAVGRLLRQFRQRDAVLREAAIRRLRPWPQAAAARTVTAFQDGPLSVRLAALELLSGWKAPVDGLDPWQPQSLTEARIKSLSAWAETAGPAPTEDPAESAPLTAAEEAEARAQIERMVRADEAEAVSIREQLARLGKRLLPLVRGEHGRSEDDRARERLTALRYRLAASPALVLQWPGGIDRLAATAFPDRLLAADELLKRAKASDEQLLLELFSDPSPLIREMSLRALRDVTGEQADGALVRLLEDPSANVRAAVLKQLAESPGASLLERLTDYARKEPDPDLVVHAVRALREIQSPARLESLIGLAKHASWRVRAEAVEGIAKMNDGYGGVDDKAKVQAVKALLESLKDEDGFVVGRAIEGLGHSAPSFALAPLLDAIGKHPELTEKIVSSLSRFGDAAAESLRKFAADPRPEVRAAAISGLVSVAHKDSLPDIGKSLSDPDRQVRIAAADAVFTVVQSEASSQLSSALPGSADETSVDEELMVEPAPPSGILGFVQGLFGGKKPAKPVPVPVPVTKPAEDLPEKNEPEKPAEAASDSPARRGEAHDRALAGIQSEKTAAAWLYEVKPLLEPLLKAEDPAERLAAARPLAVLFGLPEAVAVLEASASQRPLLHQMSEVLPYVKWELRSALFDRMLAVATGPEELSTVLYALEQTADERAAPRFWDLLKRSEANASLADLVRYGLRASWFGDRWKELAKATTKSREIASADVALRIKEGTLWQRMVALSLQHKLDAELSAETARGLFDDPKTGDEVRTLAMRVLLLGLSKDKARPLAIEAVSGDNPARQKLGLAYLSLGTSAVETVEGFTLSGDSRYAPHISTGEEAGVDLTPPEGLSAEKVRPLLQSAEPAVAAQAGYLLVLLGQPEGLKPLLDHWQTVPESETYTELVVRAVSAADDSSHVPLLRTIYEGYKKDGQSGKIRNFYWTIRSMTGDEILKFRKQIREEFGSAVLN